MFMEKYKKHLYYNTAFTIILNTFFFLIVGIRLFSDSSLSISIYVLLYIMTFSLLLYRIRTVFLLHFFLKDGTKLFEITTKNRIYIRLLYLFIFIEIVCFELSSFWNPMFLTCLIPLLFSDIILQTIHIRYISYQIQKSKIQKKNSKSK